MEVLDHYRLTQEAASTCSSYGKEGFGIPYFDGEKEEGVRRIHAFTEKKWVFTFKKIHSIRVRGGCSNPFASLARKLERFKVRYVLVHDPPPNDNH